MSNASHPSIWYLLNLEVRILNITQYLFIFQYSRLSVNLRCALFGSGWHVKPEMAPKCSVLIGQRYCFLLFCTLKKNLKNILLFEILTSRVNKYQIALCDKLDIGQENFEFKSWLYVDEHPYFWTILETNTSRYGEVTILTYELSK